MNKPHIHADLIKAWADGAKVQYQVFVPYHNQHEWFNTDTPNWSENCAWRIKPEDNPDIIVKGFAGLVEYSVNPNHRVYINHFPRTYNVLFMFDGTTNQLKLVKMIDGEIAP